MYVPNCRALDQCIAVKKIKIKWKIANKKYVSLLALTVRSVLRGNDRTTIELSACLSANVGGLLRSTFIIYIYILYDTVSTYIHTHTYRYLYSILHNAHTTCGDLLIKKKKYKSEKKTSFGKYHHESTDDNPTDR